MRLEAKNSLLCHLRRWPTTIDQNIRLLIVNLKSLLLRQIGDYGLVNRKAASSGIVSPSHNECGTLLPAGEYQKVLLSIGDTQRGRSRKCVGHEIADDPRAFIDFNVKQHATIAIRN